MQPFPAPFWNPGIIPGSVKNLHLSKLAILAFRVTLDRMMITNRPIPGTLVVADFIPHS